jgi:hypothetical protein
MTVTVRKKAAHRASARQSSKLQYGNEIAVIILSFECGSAELDAYVNN